MMRVARLQSRRLRGEIAALSSAYDAPATDAERARTQLGLLNRTWAETSRHVPHYRELTSRLGLPKQFESLEEFTEKIPGTYRETLQSARAALTSEKRGPERWASTGGSTAKPVQLPRWKEELISVRANMWVGRSWYGVEPHDRLFLLWGHSHLLGTGLRGWWNARQRELFDRLLGYYRYSAYDISRAAMEAAVEALLSFRPDYVLGYSVALDHLARAAVPFRSRLHELGIKTIIATAEGFPGEDSAPRLEDTFGCPVSMEYGAVEALGVAHTHPAGGYRVFWRSYLAEAERQGERWVLRLTSLYPRSLPLLRYELGDEIELPPGSPDHAIGIGSFERVVGRCNDYIEMPDGQRIHSEAISHAVRPCESIRGYQLLQEGDDLRLRFTSREELGSDQASGIRGRLAAIHPGLAEIRFEPVGELAQTVAGKTPMVVRS